MNRLHNRTGFCLDGGMLWFLKQFWKTLTVIGTVVGILYIPMDVQGMPTAIKPIWDWFAMVDRETYLLFLVVVFGMWIIWSDFRPYLFAVFSGQFKSNSRLEKQREIMFATTANDRHELAKRISEFTAKEPDRYKAVKSLHDALDKIETPSEVFFPFGGFRTYIEEHRGSSVACWCVKHEGAKAELTKNEIDEVYRFWRNRAKLSAMWAIQWLNGEEPDFHEFEGLIYAQCDVTEQETLDAIEKLMIYCDLDDVDVLPIGVSVL